MIPTIDSIAREQVARFQQTRYLPSWPEAVQWLNYPHTGPAIGEVLGLNTMGEYLTVVSRERVQRVATDLVGFTTGQPEVTVISGVRVGLAYGIVKPAERLHCVDITNEHAAHHWTIQTQTPDEPIEVHHRWCDGNAS